MSSLLADVRARVTSSESTRVLVLGALVGAVGGGAAGVVDHLMVLVGRVALGTADPAISEHPSVQALLAPVLTAVLAGALIVWVSSSKRPQGVAEVVEEVAYGGKISLREGLITTAAAVLTVGGGQSAGREGPIVQLAATLTSNVCEWLNLPRRTVRILVAAGAAAGIAASFNTPLGGAFFAMEILLGSFALDAFAPVVVATVVGTVVGQALFGERLALTLPVFEIGHPVELLLYPILGLICGLLTIAFRRSLTLTRSVVDTSRVHPVLLVATSGVGVGLLAIAGFPQVMGNGYRFIEQIIRGHFVSLWVLLLILVAKFVLSAWASAVRSGAGLFAPSLVLGAITGVLFGEVAGLIVPGWAPDSGAFGVVGMGALAASLAQNPVTITLMLFEMTGHYSVVLPLLITIAISSIVAKAGNDLPIYLQQLRDRGVELDVGGEELVLRTIHVGDVMRPVQTYPYIRVGTSFRALAELFLSQREDEVFVVDADRTLLGYVHIQDVKGLLAAGDEYESHTIGEVLQETPALSVDSTIASVLEQFYRSEQEALAVIDPHNKLIGVLMERDLMGALNREVLKQDSLMARFEHGPSDDRHTDFFELPEGHKVCSIPAGTEFAGRTVKELDLSHRYGVTILAVDVWEGQDHKRYPVVAELRLQAKDRLVVMGPTLQLQDLAELHDC